MTGREGPCLPRWARLRRIEFGLARCMRCLEARVGVFVTAILVGIACFFVAMIYVRPDLVPMVHGLAYARLASNPFPIGESNLAGFRILTPLISYLIGLRGYAIVFTNYIFASLLISIVYYHTRSRGISPFYALLCSLTIALTAPTIGTLAMGGYTDSLTFLLLGVGYFYRRRPWIFWISFGLGLFNREAILFLLPWLILLRWQETRNVGRLLLEVVPSVVVTIGIYWLFRNWMADRMEVEFGLRYYLVPLLNDPLHFWRMSFGYQTLGFLTVFKLLWVVPMAAVYYAWRKHDFALLLSLLFLVACAYAQFLVAFDSTRLFSMAFPCMLIAWEVLIPRNRYQIKQWIFPLLLINVLIPNIFTISGNVILNHRGLIHDLFRQLLD